MSPEHVNLMALQGLMPTLKFLGLLLFLCVAVWFLVLLIGLIIEKLENFIKGAR